jgi:hypothetical protein
VGYLVKDCIVIGMDTLLLNFASSSSGPPDGLWSGIKVMASAALTSIEDCVAAATSKGAAFDNVRVVDVPAATTGFVPLTTAS